MYNEMGPVLESYAEIEASTKKLNEALLEIISEGEMANQGNTDVAKKLDIDTLRKAQEAVERLIKSKENK